MRSLLLRLTLTGIAATSVGLSLIGCGGGSSNPPGGGSSGTTVTLTFSGTLAPSGAAAKTGNGFTPVPIHNGQISVTIPQGTNTYAIAYSCPHTEFEAGVQVTFQLVTVIEATVQDSTQLPAQCGAPSNQGAITGSVDATAIPSVKSIEVTDSGLPSGLGIGSSFMILSNAGSFALPLPSGANDVTISANDGVTGSGNTVAVKILRNQNSPGPINGGNPIVLSSVDLTTLQPLTVMNIPPGSPFSSGLENYQTANGANVNIALPINNLRQYVAVPAAAAQSGDSYIFNVMAELAGNTQDSVSLLQSLGNAGGPVSLNLPSPWTPSPPQPAALPTFAFVYSGFNGNANTIQSARIVWGGLFPGDGNALTVLATSSFQNGATSITIPDLSSTSGFPATPASGTSVVWTGNIYGSTQIAPFVSSMPPNSSVPFVTSFGTYTVP